MANLVKLIGVYRLGDKNVHIFPLSEIKDYQINAENVYKITTYFGEKNTFKHQHKSDKKHNFRFNITEKIATYYLGEIIPKNKAKRVHYHECKEGDETIIIRLKNGEEMEINDSFEVIDSLAISTGAKIINLYNPTFSVQLGR